MVYALIVEDNVAAALTLQEIVSKSDFVQKVEYVTSVAEARTYLQHNPVDILFLDVEMPEMTGLEMLQLLPKPPITICVTGSREYALEAYELQVVDYVLKPYSYTRVMLALEKAIDLLNAKKIQKRQHTAQEELFVRENKAIRKIPIKEILWIESMKDYLKIVTASRNYIVHSTLKNIAERLPADRFVRIHKSYLISLNHLDSVEIGLVNIKGTSLPISETYRNEITRRLKLL